ncbi:MAG: aminoacyl-tRNA hydrolase [bacterium]|nr:aminoacyl-tRNA hydrolase [bacterium]
MNSSPDALQIIPSLSIPLSELSFHYARSSGPGGQNVNKVETKVTLLFPVGESRSLNDHQRDLILSRLSKRINKDGNLRVTTDSHRTRGANQNAVIDRFVRLLREALHEAKPRRRSNVPKRQRRKRMENKRRKSQKKQMRRRPDRDE